MEQPSIEALDQLLIDRSGDRSHLGWIAEAPEGTKLKNLKGLIARLEVLRSAAISDERRKTIHANRYGIIARDARILHAREIRRLTSERRYATLTAFVIGSALLLLSAFWQNARAAVVGLLPEDVANQLPATIRSISPQPAS